jgi:hypothetical protein
MMLLFVNSIYAAAVGDWTTELFAKSLRSHNRPMWITACMPSTTDHTVKVSLSSESVTAINACSIAVQMYS